jgi:hypothetical protein
MKLKGTHAEEDLIKEIRHAYAEKLASGHDLDVY